MSDLLDKFYLADIAFWEDMRERAANLLTGESTDEMLRPFSEDTIAIADKQIARARARLAENINYDKVTRH